jgi:hypothetical protein
MEIKCTYHVLNLANFFIVITTQRVLKHSPQQLEKSEQPNTEVTLPIRHGKEPKTEYDLRIVRNCRIY